MKKQLRLMFLLLTALLLIVGCSPSAKETCLLVGETFNRCQEPGVIKYTDEMLSQCISLLEAVAKKDKGQAKTMAKLLKKCADMDKCAAGAKCIITMMRVNEKLMQKR